MVTGTPIQHPEIDWIENTGYPSYAQPSDHVCEECGAELDDGEVYEDERHDFLCQECLLHLHEKW